jgi:hypothetical protein
MSKADDDTTADNTTYQKQISDAKKEIKQLDKLYEKLDSAWKRLKYPH